MKRAYLVALGILALAGLTWVSTPATTYTYVVKELNQTMTGIFTFGAGAAIASGQKFYLDGGNTNYLIWDSASQQVQVYINGSLRAHITNNGVIPGFCPTSVWGLELGTECFDPVTRVKWRHDNKGIRQVAQ
jgi:hypothetical protein